VVHRDYSLTGKDIKVAVYDDMVEITSPGKLMPSIDFNELEARQSDIRNKVIAPIFKKIGVIDQWGNGLKLIAAELRSYPNIEFKWFEKGLSFQVQFIKKEYVVEPNAQQTSDFDQLANEIGTKMGLSWDQVGIKSALSQNQIAAGFNSGWQPVIKLLNFSQSAHSIAEMMELLDWRNRTKFRERYINPLLEIQILAMTQPGKPNSSKQQYFLTEKGRLFLKMMTQE
jgi:predicted HTH transcriptional regulator